jgi:hypothetical protein
LHARKAIRFDAFYAVMFVAKGDSKKDRLTRTVRIGLLLQAYGPLLTRKQKEFVELHYNEDMSFGEIAREFGVSRQAIHDAVRQAEAAMEHYEDCLGLVARGGGRIAPVGQAAPATADGNAAKLGPIIEKLAHLRRRLATQGVIYDATDYVRALDEVIAHLQAKTAKG